MSEDERQRLIHTLIYGETISERLEAQLELRFQASGAEVLRPLFVELVCYLRELVRGERPPREENVTPFSQFHDAFGQIEYLLWSWYEDEPILETLVEMLSDPDRRVRALALVGLGAGNVMWRDARVEPHLHAHQDDPDPFMQAAARLALNYILFGRHVKTGTMPDISLYQYLEQYAAQVLSGLTR